VRDLVAATAAVLLLLLLLPFIKPFKQHNAPLLQAAVVRSQRFAARV
jgi:hypothetical protein